MALAVAEAHRVLRPGGLLLDLHPVSAPLRLELWLQRAGAAPPEVPDPALFDCQALGDFAPDETLDDFAAATQALDAAVQAAGPGFAPAGSACFDYRYLFDDLDELTGYLEENEELDLAGEPLLERALLGLQAATVPARLVLVQRAIVTCLRKL